MLLVLVVAVLVVELLLVTVVVVVVAVVVVEVVVGRSISQNPARWETHEPSFQSGNVSPSRLIMFRHVSMLSLSLEFGSPGPQNTSVIGVPSSQARRVPIQSFEVGVRTFAPSHAWCSLSPAFA